MIKKNNKKYTSEKLERWAERAAKARRVMALVGVAVIVLLYVRFFVLMAAGSGGSTNALFSAFAATIIVPVIIYALGLVAKSAAAAGAEGEVDDAGGTGVSDDGTSGAPDDGCDIK